MDANNKGYLHHGFDDEYERDLEASKMHFNSPSPDDASWIPGNLDPNVEEQLDADADNADWDNAGDYSEEYEDEEDDI